MAVTVRDNADKSRYEVEVDGQVAGFTEYHLHKGVAAFTHTEILPGFEGRGLASELIAQTLDDARNRGLVVEPFCQFVRNYIGKRPEYRDLVPSDEWQRFDLA